MHAPSARTFGPALAGCCSGATTGSGADSAGAAGVGVVALRGRLLSFLSVSSLGGSTVAALRFLFLTVAAGDDGGGAAGRGVRAAAGIWSSHPRCLSISTDKEN